MKDFYYLVRATTGNNVGNIQAKSAEEALAKLKEIYAPAHPVSGKAHALVDLKLIDVKQYEVDKKHIEKKRKEEAEA
jgi:hypothetical protein